MSEPFSRRELIRRGGVLGSLIAVPARWWRVRADPGSRTSAAGASGASGLRPGADVYQSIGVRPLINARGTFTIISGSTMLPEVRAAMDAAARQYVHLDELAEAVGARLAELTRRRVGPRHERVLRGAHARHRRVRRRRQSRSPRPPPEPERLREGRGHHPDPLAQRLRRGHPRRRRARRRSVDARRIRGGARTADRADLHPGRPACGRRAR